jgi:hypothetical protein
VFRCPSDSSIAVPWVGIDNSDIEGDTPYSSWSFFGSSYPSNWYWPYYYMQAPPGSGPVYKGDFRNIIGAGSPDVPFGLGRDMLRGKSGRWASEFITFYENRLNYAMEGAEPPGGAGDGPSLSKPKSYRGWHKKWDMHAAVFLDGSSRNQKFDTRFVWGNNWTTWPNKPWRGSWEQFNELPPPD